MRELIFKIYKHICVLRLQIKILSNKEFDEFMRNLDFEQKLYAVILRYF